MLNGRSAHGISVVDVNDYAKWCNQGTIKLGPLQSQKVCGLPKENIIVANAKIKVPLFSQVILAHA